MRDRLIELLNVYYEGSGSCYVYYFTDEESEMLADYLIANGLILPPCKAGDTVYSIVCNKIQAFVVVVCNMQLVGDEASFEYKAQNAEYPMYFGGSNVGKTVFLTKEEAEKALKEKENE